MSNKANPVYFIHPLPKEQVLVACWIWYRRYLAQALPDRWELVSRAELPQLEAQCRQAGYRLIGPLESKRDEVWRQIQSAQKEPRRSPKQQAKYAARQARLREMAEAEAAWQQQLGRQAEQFQAEFRGLSEVEIRRKYRALARLHHPDAGGSAESFRLLEAIYRQFLGGN